MGLGDAIITVSEAIERYMGISDRNSTSHKSRYLLRGMEIWKDIRNNVLKIPSYSWGLVDKTKLPYRVKLPKCASLFINVGGINSCGEYENYGQYNGMHTVPYEESEDAPCSCDNSIAKCITTTESTEETIVIDGVDYTKTVETTVSSNGDVYIKTTQPIPRLDAEGNQQFTQQKTFEFPIKMLVIITNADPTLYQDSAVPADVDFHLNNIVSDIHYYNGIYTGGVSHWGNDSLADMFRGEFRDSDVGVSGYSNRGINELGGYLANTPEAYANWRSQLEEHTAYELFDKAGVVVDKVEAIHVSTVTTANEITHNINLKITVPVASPDLNNMMFNANSDNEFNFAAGTPVAGSEWEYADILLTDPTHQYDSVKTVLDPVAIVDIVTDEKLLCHLEVKECSCIEISQENLTIIENCCCRETVRKCRDICNAYFTQPNVLSLTKSTLGYYKYDEKLRTIFLYGNVPSQVLLNYKSTGEDEEDEIMPNFALMCFFMGMDWLNSRYSNTMNRLEKNDLKKDYRASKNELELDLPRNKLDITKWDDIPIGVFPKWS